MRKYLYYPRVRAKPDGPDVLPEKYRVKDWREELKTGRMFFIVPWSIDLAENGEMYVSNILDLNERPGGTVSLGIRQVDGKLHIYIPSGFYYRWRPSKHANIGGEKIMHIHHGGGE